MESKKIVSSPNAFYSYIKDLNISDPIVQKFKDHMFQFLYGCSCNAEKNWDSAMDIYKNLGQYQIPNTKELLESENIDFYLDQEFLFRI